MVEFRVVRAGFGVSLPGNRWIPAGGVGAELKQVFLGLNPCPIHLGQDAGPPSFASYNFEAGDKMTLPFIFWDTPLVEYRIHRMVSGVLISVNIRLCGAYLLILLFGYGGTFEIRSCLLCSPG